MTDMARAACPYCGEPVDLYIDADGGPNQAYVEDCPVCCRPWEVQVAHDGAGGWHATLRTLDE